MPAEGPRALSRLRVPHLDGLVIACTCYVLPVWAPCDGADTAVFDEMIQHTKQLRQGKKIRFKKKSHQSECPLSVDWTCPVRASQILMVLSWLPLANAVPSGLHATDQTLCLRCDESAHEAAQAREEN